MKIISIDPLGTKGPHSLSLNLDQPLTAPLLAKVHWIAKARGMPLSFSAEDGRLRLVEEGGVINAKTIEVVEKLLLEAEAAIANEAGTEQSVRAAMLAATSEATCLPLAPIETLPEASSAPATVDLKTLAQLQVLARVAGAAQRLNVLRDHLVSELLDETGVTRDAAAIAEMLAKAEVLARSTTSSP